MTEPFDALLCRTVNPLRSLQVGDLTVGWVGPHLDWEDEAEDGVWFAVVGDNAYPISFEPFERQCNILGLETPIGYYSSRDYRADFFFNMPVGAVDISGGDLAYTELTVESLRAAISNLEPVLKSDIQSRLNNADMLEASKLYGTLLRGEYPHTFSMNWRGTPLTKLRVEFYQILRDWNNLSDDEEEE